MKIKLKNIELASAHNRLSQLSTIGLPAKASIMLDNILEELNNKAIELKKHRLALVAEHGDKANTLLHNLWMEEIELTAEPIPIECLNDVSLTLVNARNLRKFVVI